MVAARTKAVLLRSERLKWPLSDILSEGANRLEKAIKEGNIFEVVRELVELEKCFMWFQL